MTTTLWVLGGAVLASLALALAAGPASAAAATLRVETTGNDSGDCTAGPCATIQYAVDQASAGDTIEVGPGTYTEEVEVEKEVTLRGANASVAATGARGPETTVTGAGTKVLGIHGPGVTVEGFTIEGAAIYSVLAQETSGLKVADDIIRGSQGLVLAAESEADTIEGNLIEGALYTLVLAGPGVHRDLRVADNSLLGAAAPNYTMFNPQDGATFPGLQVVDNHFRGSDNIAGDVEGGTVSGNTFEVDAAGELALQIDLHESTVSGNSFEGNGGGACLQLFGSQFGLDPSDGAAIAGNRFDGCTAYAVQLSPDVDHVAITGNTITNSYDAINTRLLPGEAPWDLSGRTIRIVGNRIVGSTHLGIENSVEGTLDAADNWWGCNAGPALAAGNGCDPVSTGVQAAPWLVLTTRAPASVRSGDSATVTAAIDSDSSGAHVTAVPDGTPVSYSTDLGTVNPLTGALANGTASTVLVSNTSGNADVAATVDHQTVTSTVRIESDSTPSQTPRHGSSHPSPAKPIPPQIHLVGGGSPLTVSPGGTVTIATIACPQGSCLIAIKQRKVKIGRRGYALRLRLDRLVTQGKSTSVTAVLPRAARRALAARGKGRAIVRLRLFSGAGMQELPIKVRVKAPTRARRARS